MQRLRTINQIYVKRLIRPTYAHHQATPYLVNLDPSLRAADNSIRVPINTDTTPLTRSATAFTLNNSLVPGLCVTRTSGENVTISTGIQSAAEYPFGLLGNWLGGDYDDVGSENEAAAWRGPDSTYTLLAPAFNDTGAGNTNGQSLSTAFAAAATTGVPVKLYAGSDGRLYSNSAPTATMVVVAHLIDRPAAARIVVDLKI